MNDRIKELVEQATKRYPATESSGEFSTFDKEKFAELMLKECLHIVDDEGCGEGGSVRAIEKIKEHFGVEE